MIRNYFLLFFRNLARQKLFSFINLLGLTISIVSTMLIYLYVRHEFSFDRFHKSAEDIYRVNQTFIWGDNTNYEFASTGPGVATALKDELPEVKMLTSIYTPGNFVVSYTTPARDVVAFEESRILAGDSNFFRMFNFPLLSGDPNTVLNQAQTLVMTEETARKYFGDDNPVGKQVRLSGLGGGDPRTFEVSGVVKKLPTNSYIDFDILVSMNSYPQIKRLYWSWIYTQLETFVLLDHKASIENVRAKLQTIPRKYAEETLRRTMNTSFDEYVKSGKKWELFLQPMTRIHLPKHVTLNRIGDSGNIKIIWSLIGGAFFIILLSCVNFMNLSTAQFTRRIKEASIRKILGLGRKQLGIGYFVEATTFCFLALLLAVATAQLLLPGFNYVTGKTLTIDLLGDPSLMLALGGLVVLMSAISSSYPALFLSAFHPVEGMKGKLKSGKQGKSIRNGLVVFQFMASIVLIICTTVVFQQLNFVNNKEVGFNRDNLMVLKHVEGVKSAESFANELKTMPGVTDVTLCSSVPPSVFGGDKFTADGMNGATFSLNFNSADEHYLKALDIKLKLGRNFSERFPADSTRIILNEAAVKKIGWPLDETVIGRKIRGGGDREFEVIGVVADYNYWTLAMPIEPMGMFHIKNHIDGEGDKQFIVIRLQPQSGDQWNNSIAEINKSWKRHAGDSPFQYEFIDQAFAATFKTQQQFGKVLTVMATLAILIACLGLLGIIIYSLEQRSKEIGIRKVSGASVLNIMTLISSGYARLILIAFLLASPIAWYLMNEWLKEYSYRVTLSPWIFISVGIGVLVLAAIITSYHAVKAAMTNPVQVLRDE